jgi:hypothetical protein
MPDDISLVLDEICLAAADKICPETDNIYTPMGNNHSSSDQLKDEKDC